MYSWERLGIYYNYYYTTGVNIQKNKARKRRDHVYPMKKGGRVEYVIESPSRKPLKEPVKEPAERRKEKKRRKYIFNLICT